MVSTQKTGKAGREIQWREALNYTPRSETHAAISVALEAASVIRASLGRGHVEAKAGTHNVVTEGDRASGRIIRPMLESIFPGDEFLTEETTKEVGTGDSNLWLAKKRLWVIDELDGSSNQKDRIEDVNVSIAFIKEGDVKTGVIYNPYRNELLIAEDEQDNAFYVKLSSDEEAVETVETLRVSQRTELKGASFETSMAYDPEVSIDHNLIRLALNLGGKSGRPREIGSTVGQLGRVARGQSDFHFNKDAKPWDLAAGSLIIRKGGGIFVGMDGSNITLMSRHSVAGNETVVRQFIEFNNRMANDTGFKRQIIREISGRIEHYKAT